MTIYGISLWKLAAGSLRALLIGVCSGAFLVTAFTYLSGYWAASVAQSEGGDLLVPLAVQWQFALVASSYYAVAIAVLCAPVWLILARLKLDAAPTAAVLGFVATMACWVLINFNGLDSAADLISTGLPYAACGSLAGVVTWISRPRALRIPKVEQAAIR